MRKKKKDAVEERREKSDFYKNHFVLQKEPTTNDTHTHTHIRIYIYTHTHTHRERERRTRALTREREREKKKRNERVCGILFSPKTRERDRYE